MRFTATEIVRGASRFEGDIDGTAMKSATVFVDVSLDDKGKGWGHRTEPMRCESLEVIDRIKHLPFPLKAELTIEQKASKNKTQLIVVDVKPISQGKV